MAMTVAQIVENGASSTDTHYTTHYRGVEIACCRTPRSSHSASPIAQTVLCHAAACGRSSSSPAGWLDRCPSCTHSDDAPLHEVRGSDQALTLRPSGAQRYIRHASSTDGQVGGQRCSHSPTCDHPSTSRSARRAVRHFGTVESSSEPYRHAGQAHQNHADNIDRSR